MKTRQEIESAIQQLGGLSNLGNLSEKQLIKMYHLHMRLLYSNDAEDPQKFLEYVEWCVRKLERINGAYNRVAGKEVDLWFQYKNKKSRI